MKVAVTRCTVFLLVKMRKGEHTWEEVCISEYCELEVEMRVTVYTIDGVREI
jgi:hypothetical protein